VVVLLVPVAALWLTRGLSNENRLRVPSIGPWRSAERRVLGLFALTALAWVTRSEPFGGWSQWWGVPAANDASVAFIAVIALFILRDREGQVLITWRQAVDIPWGILLLFSGGICLAKGLVASGVSEMAGMALSQLASLPSWLMIAAICLGVTFLTEATSNTATTALLMPVLAAAAVAANIDPRLMMVPAALSASCAFMLPVATGPNAVVFGSDQIPIQRMVREGLAVNLIGVLIVASVVWLQLGS